MDIDNQMEREYSNDLMEWELSNDHMEWKYSNDSMDWEISEVKYIRNDGITASIALSSTSAAPSTAFSRPPLTASYATGTGKLRQIETRR